MMILAVCGKGGVGKTTVSAVAAKALSGMDGVKALVIDADPSGGLRMALGVDEGKTLEDVRKQVIGEVQKGGRDRKDLAVSVDYLLAEAMTEVGNLAFLSIGRPEDAGCYCRVNVLMREVVEGVSDRFDVTVVDAEAGIEQVNRKVLGAVDFVLLVSDTSGKGIRVAEDIRKVAETMVRTDRFGLLVNRVLEEGEVDAVERRTSLPVLGWIPEDETIRKFDGSEKSFFELPDCPASLAIVGVLEKTGLLG